MFIAVYINTHHGDFIPVGSFKFENMAEEWIADNVHESKHDLWSVFKVIPPHLTATSVLVQKASGVSRA